MVLSFSSIARESTPSVGARRQPSHVPPWVVAEARLVDALPCPRPRLVRDALGATLGALACTAVGVALVALLS
jgi:hypothetical protein